MAVATRLTNTGTLLVNGSFDENTSIAPSQFRTTGNTVFAGELDEITIAGGSVAKRETNTGVLQVSTQFDEFTGAPIVDSSLILWLDAAQTASYPGTGVSWTDLSGGGRNCTLDPAMPFSTLQGGRMEIAAGGFAASGATSMTIASSHTVSIWITPTVSDGTIRRFLTINTANDSIVLRNDGISGTGQLHYYIRLGFTFFNVRVNLQVTAGQTANFVGTWDGATMRLYKNGSQINSLGSVSGALSVTSTNYRISSVTEGMVGNFFQAMVYNRALSAQEVLDNFNAIRGRYNI